MGKKILPESFSCCSIFQSRGIVPVMFFLALATSGRRGANSSEDTSGSLSLPALTNAHPSRPGNLGDAGLGFSLHVITQIPHTRAAEPRGEQGEGAGLARVTVIGGGHRQGTPGDNGGIYQGFRGEQLLRGS